MAKPTQQSRLIAALIARGYVLGAGTRVTRYAVYKPTADARMLLKPADDLMDHRVYVGKMGALRFAVRGVVAQSVPFSDRTIAHLLREGENALTAAAAIAAVAKEARPSKRRDL